MSATLILTAILIVPTMLVNVVLARDLACLKGLIMLFALAFGNMDEYLILQGWYAGVGLALTSGLQRELSDRALGALILAETFVVATTIIF